MKRILLLLLPLLIGACTPSTSGEDPAQLSGKVVGIADGDTFTLLLPGNTTKKIRLYGVDAPERKQPFGTVARQRLSELIFSKQVSVKEKDVDRYGRTVGEAFIEGRSVNEEMLRSGLVWHYTQYDKNPRWEQLQEEARRARIGLWQDPNPTPPWQWRKVQREKKKAA